MLGSEIFASKYFLVAVCFFFHGDKTFVSASANNPKVIGSILNISQSCSAGTVLLTLPSPAHVDTQTGGLILVVWLSKFIILITFTSND